jgi:hypothetical protein
MIHLKLPNNTGAPRAAVPTVSISVLLRCSVRAVCPCCAVMFRGAHPSARNQILWLVGAVLFPEINMNRLYVGGVTATPAAMLDGCNLARRHALQPLCKSYAVTAAYCDSPEFQDETQIHNYYLYCKVVRTAL